MTAETELKLRITPEAMDRLRRHAFFRPLQIARPQTRRNYSIYFDTPKLDLLKSGYALRLRKQGRQWLQTLKGGGSIQGGLHQREEYEVLLNAPQPDLGKLQHVEIINKYGKKLAHKLQPLFVTDFQRTTRLIRWEDAQIEISFDRGFVLTEQHSVPLCETELELKQGEPQQLYTLAMALQEIVPFALEDISKAEQGYRLYAGKARKPVKAKPLKLHRHDSLARSMQLLMGSCLQQFQANLQGAKSTDSAEYIHQMRIALRRLRVLLRMVAELQADVALQIIREQWAALGHQLGAIREWDVLLQQTLKPMRERMPEHAGIQQLLLLANRQRDIAWHAFIDDAYQRRLQNMLLQFGSWMTGNDWYGIELTSQTASSYAEKHITQARDRFNAARHACDMQDIQQLHALRIKAKHLRYGIEFFSGLLDKYETKKLLSGLTALQDRLGMIHDNAMAMQLLEKLVVDQSGKELQEAVTLAKGWLQHELAEKSRKLRKCEFSRCGSD